MPKTRSRRRHGGVPTTPRRCAHCGEHYLHNSPTRFCGACRPQVRLCCECRDVCVPVYSLSPQTRRTAGRCQRCHDNPLIHQPPDHAPPPSVDPGRPDRLKKYADRAAEGLPLFDRPLPRERTHAVLEIDHAARSESLAHADLFRRAAATAREQGLHHTLTTGEVARLFDVATRTVSKWFDSGRIKGWRLPCSKDRRFVMTELVAFCEREGIPLPPGVRADLLIGGAPTLHAELAAASWRTGVVDTVHSAVEMAHRLGRHPYAACLAGPALGRHDLREVARAAQGLATRLVYVQGDDDPCPQEMRDAGWVLTWGDPENALGALLGRATP